MTDLILLFRAFLLICAIFYFIYIILSILLVVQNAY